MTHLKTCQHLLSGGHVSLVYVSVHKGHLNHPTGKAAQNLYSRRGDRLSCFFLDINNNNNNYHSLGI